MRAVHLVGPLLLGLVCGTLLLGCSSSGEGGGAPDSQTTLDSGAGDVAGGDIVPSDVALLDGTADPDGGVFDSQSDAIAPADAAPDGAAPVDVAEDVPADTGGCPPDCPEMVTVTAGSFMMGCEDAFDLDCVSFQLPVHEVSFAADFEIDRVEVSNGAYAAFLDENGNDCGGEDCVTTDGVGFRLSEDGGAWSVEEGYEDHPVAHVTWFGAAAYCDWVDKRLCSSAEWEYAARGPDGYRYPWGDSPAPASEDWDPTLANCQGARDHCNDGYEKTSPVDAFPNGASPFGALGMLANVGEWVADDWHGTFEDAPTDGSAWEDEPRAAEREMRGGDYNSYGPVLFAWQRFFFTPDESYSTLGFRCCRP